MRHDSRQQPLFPVKRFLSKPYETGSIFDIIARYGGYLFRRSDFPEADRSLGGQTGWCPVQLSALVVLQQKHSWTDRETVRRATVDLQVKACLGMGIEQQGPNQSTLCRHRQQMQQLGLDVIYLQRLREVLEVLQLVRNSEPVLIDSVPIDGAGQQLDTYNLLAGAILHALRELAQLRGRALSEVAASLGLGVYLGRSVKGRFEVNWEDEESRRQFLAQLVHDAKKARDCLMQARQAQDQNSGSRDGGTNHEEGGGTGESSSDPAPGDSGQPTSQGAQPDEVSSERSSGASAAGVDCGGQDQSCGNSEDTTQSRADNGELESTSSGAVQIIDSILAHDVEFTDKGEVKGIRQAAAGDRVISVTDPEMRHGRKSASKLIAGFKAQVVASLAFGFIVLVRVIKANVHDGQDLSSIAAELEDKGIVPDWWGGDHAYGTIANHQFFSADERGELVARMPRPANGGRFTKDEFNYDFHTRSLSCPAGHQLEKGRWITRGDGRRGRLFEFPKEVCEGCPLKQRCINPKSKGEQGRTVFIVDAEERLIRDHLERRGTEEFQQMLKNRPAVERVIAGFAQCGGKTASRYGTENVQFGGNLSALAYNLRLIGGLLAKKKISDAELVEAMKARGRTFLRALCRQFLAWCLPSQPCAA